MDYITWTVQRILVLKLEKRKKREIEQKRELPTAAKRKS